jgi:hypothetical protein
MLAKVGITSDKGFDDGRLNEKQKAALQKASTAAVRAIGEKLPTMGKMVNSWQMPDGDVQGVFEGNYLRRAAFIMIGLGVIVGQEAVYPITRADKRGESLNGNNNYVLTFSKNAMPPADAFWSISLYGDDRFFVDNEIDRYALGNRSDLHFEKDGSLTFYLQRERPKSSEQKKNWLPTPEGGFYLVLRIYLPRPEVLDGSYSVPAVEKSSR